MTNNLTRFFALLLVSLALLSAPVISGSYDTPFAVTAEAASKKSPSISAKKKTVYYKSKVTLKINNYKGKVKWSTSNKKVATVNSKGEVTGVALGECTIKAKTSNKTFKCTVTVKDRNVSSSVDIKVNGGGYFVKGESTAKVTVKPKKYNAAKATVVIKNASGTTVYKKTLTKLEKNKSYSFDWDGKNTKGKYVSTGSYTVKVKIGEKTSSSSAIKFYAKNDFAGGNGAKKNPFVIASTTQLKKIVKYPKAYFKQTKDLDFKYTEVGGFFSEDLPFNGVYDGNGKAIKNITATKPLFNSIGEKGVVKRLKIKDSFLKGNTLSGALLVYKNEGLIDNCEISGNLLIEEDRYDYLACSGLIATFNYGTISNSKADGSIFCKHYYFDRGTNVYMGGIVGRNCDTGKITSCEVYVDLSVGKAYIKYIGGVSGDNDGLISDCSAAGGITGEVYDDDYCGGITGKNNGRIISSYYTGESIVNLAGTGNGVIA